MRHEYTRIKGDCNMMLKSREDLIMIIGPLLAGGGRYPMIQRCSLCGGGGDGDHGDIVHGDTCVLADTKVTHVRMIGCRYQPKPVSDAAKIISGWAKWKQKICMLHPRFGRTE